MDPSDVPSAFRQTIVMREHEIRRNRSNVVTTIAGQNSRAVVLPELSVGQAVSHAVVLAICCFISYTIITDILARLVPRDDELLGGMWAVIATIFVFRYSYEESARAALSRTSA